MALVARLPRAALRPGAAWGRRGRGRTLKGARMKSAQSGPRASRRSSIDTFPLVNRATTPLSRARSAVTLHIPSTVARARARKRPSPPWRARARAAPGYRALGGAERCASEREAGGGRRTGGEALLVALDGLEPLLWLHHVPHVRQHRVQLPRLRLHLRLVLVLLERPWRNLRPTPPLGSPAAAPPRLSAVSHARAARKWPGAALIMAPRP